MLFAEEEMSDRDALQYRIDNHINELNIEGLRTETLEHEINKTKLLLVGRFEFGNILLIKTNHY